MRTITPSGSESDQDDAPARTVGRSLMVRAALVPLEAVATYKAHARAYFHVVMLSGQECPNCHGNLTMIRDGCCRCELCGTEFDSTTVLQRCVNCGGAPHVRIRRYECDRCAAQITSQFLFDALVFDADYFRHKMAEHRQRRRVQRERIRQMLAETRSPHTPPAAAELEAVPGLIAALNGLSAGALPEFTFSLRQAFDLKRYEAHVRAHSGPIAVKLDRIPPLSENTRVDRIWRFVAVIFLTHAGELSVRQDGTTIWVMQAEADGERQGLPGNAEGADELERPVGRAET